MRATRGDAWGIQLLNHGEAEKMKAAYDACERAKVKIPKEVADYFDGGKPNADGIIHEIDSRKGHDSDGAYYVEIDVTSLPKNVSRVRVRL